MAVVDLQIEALARVFLASGMRVRQALLTATAGGYTEARCKLILAQIEAELARLNTYVATWETGQLQLSYSAGADEAAARLSALREAAPGQIPESFSALPQEPLKALSREIAGQRSQFVGAILRQSRDYLRTLSSGELARGLGIGDGPADIGRAIRDKSIGALLDRRPLQALAQRIDRACGVVYSDGSVHSLHAYGQMSARTGMLASYNEGSVQRYQTAGVHLAQVSTHGTLCFLCEPLEGCVFALDAAGEGAGYPRADFDLPRHPNCRHSWVPYLEAAFGPGQKIDPAVAAMDDRQLYARMRDDVPSGAEKMAAARNGFRNWPEYQRLSKEGAVHGPRWREAGIESRRLEATRRVLESGGSLTYAQAMGQVTGERMKAEGRGIFAARGAR